MQKHSNILYIFYNIILITISSLIIYGCSSNKNIINKDDMAIIVSQMYLADQYIERTPELRAQTDTMYVYKSILDKMGYSFDDYQKSILHYLKKGNSYYKINVQARDMLKAEENKLIQEIAKANKTYVKWWAIDSLKSLNPINLIYYPEIRRVKWLLFFNDYFPWKMGDENIKDIPLNIDWWLNNYNILTVDSIVNKYNILDKDYSIRLTDSLKFVVDTLGKDNITTSLEILKSDENNKRELYTPNNRRANKKRLLENR